MDKTGEYFSIQTLHLIKGGLDIGLKVGILAVIGNMLNER